MTHKNGNKTQSSIHVSKNPIQDFVSDACIGFTEALYGILSYKIGDKIGKLYEWLDKAFVSHEFTDLVGDNIIPQYTKNLIQIPLPVTNMDSLLLAVQL